MTLGLGCGFHARPHGDMGGDGWSPSRIDDLYAWYDAADPATILHDEGAVTAWNDKSGNGHHAVQTVPADRPLTGARSLGGRNTVYFQGDSQQLFLPAGMSGIVQGDSTLVTVFVPDTPSLWPFCFLAGGGRRYGLELHTANGLRFWSRDETDFIPCIWDSSKGYIGVNRTSGNAITGFFEGASIAGTNSEGAWATLPSVRLMGGFNGTSAYFHGRLAEIILYERALSVAEINRIGAYLSRKWGAGWLPVL
ncbi:MAG: hypothetical protein WC989_00065 [Micavibrio sp.]